MADVAIQEPILELFERWRSRGDTDALARVFDATAPRLLALAVHLAGNVPDAEDLVQQTFLTAIERSSSFDRTRPLEPWLAGILSNHARELRRSVVRSEQVARVPEREQGTPVDEVEESEDKAVVAAAVDRLEEPYRTVLILAVRHAMSPAEIAYALQRSPGAVRVQLHRGRELLRRFLPAAWIAGEGATRGLAAVRGVVLGRARMLRPLAAGASIAGGILVGKKLVVGVVLLAFCVLIGLLGSRLGASRDLPKAPPLGAQAVEVERTAPSPGVSQSSERTSPVVAADETAHGVRLRCRVIDGDTGEGVPDAEVSLYGAQKITAAELRRRWSDRLIVDRLGYLQGRPWPKVMSRLPADAPMGLTEEELFGLAALRVHAPPEKGAIPIASVRSDAQGWFEMRAPTELGFLRCEARGYALRQRALDADELGAAGKDELTIKLTLQRPRIVRGRIVTRELQPIARSLRLGLFGHLSHTATYTPSRDGPITQRDLELDRQCDNWSVETRPDGSFECELDAVLLLGESLDPEWTVVEQRTAAAGGAASRLCAWFDTDERQAELLLVLVPATALAVSDAVTHQPIEEIELECVQSESGRVMMRGPFFARGGRLRLSARDWGTGGRREDPQERAACRLTVWARGYQASTQRIPDLVTPGLVRVELQPGATTGVDVELLDGGRPVEQARAGLVPVHGPQWFPTMRGLVGLALADAAGRVHLDAPPGRYALYCGAGERSLWQIVEVPSAGPLRVDLSLEAAIRVEARSAEAGAEANVRVELRGSDGRWAAGRTDGQGRIRFGSLVAGSYKLHANGPPVRQAEVELVGGQEFDCELSAPRAKSRFARLVLANATPPRGWTACDLHGGYPRDLGACSIEVQPDGRIPIELVGETWVSIISPTRQAWSCHVPADAPDGYAIELDPDGPGYRGTLTSAADGSALRGVRVFAKTVSSERQREWTVITLTDEQGRFELSGLGSEAYYLRFEGPGGSINDYDKIFAFPRAVPGTEGAELAIALPLSSSVGVRGLPMIDVRGRVRSATRDVRKLYGAVRAVLVRSSCDLQIRADVRLEADGRYEARLPAATEYRAWFWLEGEEHPAELRWNSSVADGVELHDFDLP